MKVNDYPLIKTLILFLIGFYIAYNFKIDLNVQIIFLCIALLFTIFLNRFNSKYGAISIAFAVVLLGSLIFSSKFYENEKEIKLFDALSGKKVLLYGNVEKVEYFDKDKIQFILNGENLVLDGKWIPVNQNFFVNFNINESSFPSRYFEKIISPGNKIRISGNILKPEEPKIIGEFDYKFYLMSRDINYILYSNIFDDLNLIEENKSIFNFSRYLNSLRQKLKMQIENNFDQVTAAYIKGLFIAERSDISEEIKEDFVNSGVIHVLAVSGLHTGYIALILLAFTGRLNRWLKIIFVSIGLFVFAHLANLSPSVVRASLMSIAVLISYSIERQNSLLNSIALAALLILIFKPLDLFNPGFQLSFAAVLSIGVIYPVLLNLSGVSRMSGWKKTIFDLILISLAVSIGTFPFVASYYHKFSVIALLANLVVIPLTGVILGGIILNLVTINFLPFTSFIYKTALTELININFSIVKFFANIPFAYLPIRNFSLNHTIIYFLMIVLVIMVVNKKYKPGLKFLFIALLIFNYVFHFNFMSNVKMNLSGNKLILIKLANSNSIFCGNKESNLFNFYEKNDSLKLVANDFKKLDRIFWQLNHDYINYSIIFSPAIFLKNDFKSRINSKNIFRVGNNVWLFGGQLHKSIGHYEFVNDKIKYKLFEKSFTEVCELNDWVIIISPISFNSIKEKFLNRDSKFIYLKPELDTLWMNLNQSELKILPLNIEKNEMKIFDLKTSEITELKWR